MFLRLIEAANDNMFRYFFIADRVIHGELKIEYCSTDGMPADFFTKPLQGKKFFQFPKQIMNIKD